MSCLSTVDLESASVGKGIAHCIADLEMLFNQCFEHSENTILLSGADEPLYLPVGENGKPAEIHARSDYFASALHEISHWCIAGSERRKQVDFGYWYEPDGRDEAKQAEFERVEVKPQALEWLFSEACGFPFRLSADNVAQPELRPSRQFALAVLDQAKRYLEGELNERARVFLEALQTHYGMESVLESGEGLRASKLGYG